MDGKKWYNSKTVWGGMLLCSAGVTTALGQLLSGEIDVMAFMASVGVAAKGAWDVYNRFNTFESIQ